MYRNFNDNDNGYSFSKTCNNVGYLIDLEDNNEDRRYELRMVSNEGDVQAYKNNVKRIRDPLLDNGKSEHVRIEKVRVPYNTPGLDTLIRQWKYDKDNCRYHKILVNGVSAWNCHISVFLARALFLVDVDDPEELQVERSHIIDNNIPTHRTVVGKRCMPIMKR